MKEEKSLDKALFLTELSLSFIPLLNVKKCPENLKTKESQYKHLRLAGNPVVL